VHTDSGVSSGLYLVRPQPFERPLSPVVYVGPSLQLTSVPFASFWPSQLVLSVSYGDSFRLFLPPSRFHIFQMTCGYIVMLCILVREVLPFEVVQPVDGVRERDGD
jgi:hypothetical protein